jgi:hypothetical protein
MVVMGYCGSNTTARLNDCTMKHNGGDVWLHIVVGISAGDGKVNIHLPPQHIGIMSDPTYMYGTCT